MKTLRPVVLCWLFHSQFLFASTAELLPVQDLASDRLGDAAEFRMQETDPEKKDADPDKKESDPEKKESDPEKKESAPEKKKAVTEGKDTAPEPDEAAYKASEFPISPDTLKAILIFKSDSGGQGTGFIARRKVSGADRFFVYTNQHIVAGTKTVPKAYRMDGSEVKLGRLFLAKGSDVALFSLEKPEPHFLELVTDMTAASAPGQKLATPGNSGGGSTVTLKFGKVVAVGPARVEIDALIKGGNSGGPIIHESGKVIGIVAYFTQETKDDPRLRQKQELVIRRFGYRLDNIKSEDWVVPDWNRFVLQGERFAKVEKMGESLIEAYNSKLEKWGGNEEVGRVLTEYHAGRQRAVNEKMFYGRLTEVSQKMRDLCLNDINALSREDLYWWWQNNLETEKKMRQELFERFDKMHKESSLKR